MGNDREKALALYEWNLDLSSALIVPLQVCEVAVRNGIAEAIEHVHGANWPWNNGFIRSLPRPKSKFRYNPANDLQSCAASLPTTGKIIAELKFAFWENIFTVGQDSRIRSEEHTSELQSLMRRSYAVFCSKQQNVTSEAEH